MKILIVENETLFADSLERLFHKNGYETEFVLENEDGAVLVETGNYDLLVLDAMMQKENGYKLVREIRGRRCGIPILMLTEKEDTEEEIACLEAGADCCLERSFDSRKLLAYVHVLLRHQGDQRNVLSAGDILLDLANSTLSCGDASVRLSAREFDVMRFLMSAKGQILPKKQILCKVWGYDTDAVENHVEVYIGMLRKKLRKINSKVRISAIRRLGYLMEKTEE